MQGYKEDFIEFMLDAGVLTFGDFTTKSGRKTPYFVNTGLYRTGEQIAKLGSFYAASITERLGTDFDVLFGPAYKGIPLVITTAAKLHEEHGVASDWCFNRKEAKDHGEGGSLVGHKLEDGDRVLIVEDVTTAGTAIREAVPILRAAADIRLAGLIVSVDRQERGTGDNSALQELAETYEMPTFAIVTLDEILEYLRGREVGGQVLLSDELLERIDAYRSEYGAR